jgi:phage gpG-like protein
MRQGDVILWENIIEAIDAAIDRLKNAEFRESLTEAKVAIHRRIRAGFNSSADPQTDENWAPRKGRYPHPILIKTGRLMQAATGGGAGAIQEVAPKRLTIGVSTASVPYGRFHQAGAGKMPARPFVGATPDVVDQIGEMIADEGLKAFA